MAHWLPYHMDRYFLHMQEAFHGVYEPQFEPAGERPADSNVTDLRDVRAAASRHAGVIRRYQEKKLTRGR